MLTLPICRLFSDLNSGSVVHLQGLGSPTLLPHCSCTAHQEGQGQFCWNLQGTRNSANNFTGETLTHEPTYTNHLSPGLAQVLGVLTAIPRGLLCIHPFI